MATIINASTSNGLIQTADTSGTLQLQSGGTTKFTVDSTGAYGQIQSGTAQASTSGTSITFSSIPSSVKRISILFNGVSSSSTSSWQIQIGSGSVTTTGYSAAGFNTAGGALSSTTGFILSPANVAALVYNGIVTIANFGSNTYVSSGNIAPVTNTGSSFVSGGSITLSGALDRVVITTVSGTDTFDAGSINILYE